MTAVAPPPAQIPTGVPSNPSRPTSSASNKPESRKTSAEPRPTVAISAPSADQVKKEEAKSPKTETTAPPAAAAEAHRAQRPPPRPHAAFKSTFDLEPNPFEQSFSRSSHHSNSSSSEDRNTPPRGTDATAIKHNALPPLSSLTSPAAADPSQFPWLASQSLRTGPLSPAMLAGPQGHAQNGTRNGQNGDTNVQEGGAFDSTTFRTGFTPGTGSGFTPSYSSLMGNNFASSLPMPSPNTAAFLNMVTNSTPLGESGDATQNGTGQPHLQPGQTGPDGQPLHPPTAIPPHMQSHHGLSHLGAHAQGDGQQQDTITPGTLSALTGVFNDMNRGAQIQHPPMNGQVVPPQFFQPNMHHPQGPPPPAMPPHGVPGVDFAQQTANAASQAANGLFLLSQAHQELSKREEEGRGPPLSGKKGGVNAANIPRPPTNTTGSKRKSDAGPAKGTKKGKKNNGGANASLNSPPNTGIQPGLASSKGDSASPNFEMDMDSEDEEARIARGGKPETEEEKRKNFLERNRQAALKCRQRKKAWLQELQQKVEQLTVENERLQQTIGGLHDEVGRLSSILMQHRDCGLGVPAGYGRPIR